MQGASAPNISGGFQTSRRYSRLSYGGVESVPIQNVGNDMPGGKAIVFGAFKNPENSTNGSSSDFIQNSDYNIGFKFSASYYSSVYIDGAELKPMNFAVRWMVRCF